MSRRLNTGEACAAVLGQIARDLHLTGQRKHIRIQARLRQHRRIDVLRRGVCLGLLEQPRECAEADLEGS